MAIQNQSNLNEYMAQSLKTRGFDHVGVYSGDALDDDTKGAVESIVRKYEIQGKNNAASDSFRYPDNMYDEIAVVLLPTTPGMTKSTLSQSLRTNQVFGLAKNDKQDAMEYVTDRTLGKKISNYNNKALAIANATDAQLGQVGLGGFLPNIVNDISGQARQIINDALTGRKDTAGKQISVDKATSNLVSSITTGNGKANIENIPVANERISELAGDALDAASDVNFGDMTPGDQDSLTGEVIKNVTDAVDAAEDLGSDVGEFRKTIAGTIDGSETLPGPPPYEIGTEDVNVSAGGNYVSSVEELEAEMGSMTREISEIILHWSETFSNANLTATDLDTVTGAGKNAYHLIIKRDGAVQRGVPMNSAGSHCPTLGHNQYSIGVCLVGGLNVASGADDLYEATSARGITRAQYNSLYQIFKAFFAQYPGGQALGHGEIDPSQDDPGFDVRDYVYNNFNKVSLYKDPTSDPALSPDDILAALDVPGPDILTKDPDVMEKKF